MKRELTHTSPGSRRKKIQPSLTAIAFYAAFSVLAVALNAQQVSSDSSSDPLTRHYTEAGRALSNGDQHLAAAEYKNFLAEALHRAANAEARIGEASKAAEYFTQALEFTPTDSTLLDDYASFSFDRNELPEAESILNKALAVNDNDSRARFVLARVLFNEEKYLAAKPNFEFAHNNGEQDAWYLLGITDLKLQDRQSAQSLFERMLVRLGDKASTHFRLGMAYYNGDYPDEAIVEFKKAIAQNPGASDQHYYLGLAYLGHNPEAGFAKAEPEFRAELQLSPNDFRSHYMLGYILLNSNRLPEAEREITQARELKPDDRNTLLLAAELFNQTNRLSEAEGALRKAIAAKGDTQDYNLIRIHYMLGRILQRTGREEEAKKELDLSEQLRSQFRAASGGTLKERSGPGLNSAQSKRPEDISQQERSNAEQFLRSLSSPVSEAFNNLGAIAASQHKCPDCVGYFRGAKEWGPSSEDIDRNLGRAAYLCQQYKDAIGPLSQYLKQHESDTVVRAALALSLFQIGEYTQVVQVLEPIKSSIQSNSELSNALAISQQKTRE